MNLFSVHKCALQAVLHWECTGNWLSSTKKASYPSSTSRHSTWTNTLVRKTKRGRQTLTLSLSSPGVGIPDDHPESYHTYMWQNLFQHIDIDPTNVHILDGNAQDLQKECDDFEQSIKDAGGVDLFVGGWRD